MVKSRPLLILFLIQVTFTLGHAPLKCLLHQSEFMNVFSKSNIPASFYDVYKVKPLRLDPMELGSVTLDQDDLIFVSRDLQYTGFKDATIDEFGINFQTNLTRIFFHADITAKSLYQVSGVLFSVPISGEGNLTAFFKDLKIEIVMPFRIERDDHNRRYIDLKTYYYWADVSATGDVSFTNLYNGNKEQSDMMHSMLNENFRVFATHFGKPYKYRIVDHLFHIFRNYMLQLPLRDVASC